MIRLPDEGRELLRVAAGISRRIEAEWAVRVGERRWHQLRQRVEDAILTFGLQPPMAEGRERSSSPTGTGSPV